MRILRCIYSEFLMSFQFNRDIWHWSNVMGFFFCCFLKQVFKVYQRCLIHCLAKIKSVVCLFVWQPKLTVISKKKKFSAGYVFTEQFVNMFIFPVKVFSFESLCIWLKVLLSCCISMSYPWSVNTLLKGLRPRDGYCVLLCIQATSRSIFISTSKCITALLSKGSPKWTKKL